MSSQVEFAAVMVPANGQAWWWYNGITGEQVGQFLTQNKAMLTDINAYIDTDNTLKFVVAMEPVTEGWWWYWGQTAEQVGQLLTQNKAVIKKVSPYIDPGTNTLKFAVIMTATGPASWWYFGLTGEQVGQHLAQNRAMLTDISAYIDTDATVKFAVIMAEGQGTWWWWWGQTGAQVGQLLTQNKAGLTDISAYVDPSDNTLKFAVIMAEGQDAWWYWGKSGAQLGQLLTQNKARLAVASAYLASSENSITINTNPNISGLDGNVTLTVQESGAYSFTGSWSPSNVLTGLAAQDVNLVLTLRDMRGTVWVFSTSGTVPVEGTYSFNNHGTNPSLAENWQFLQPAYTWHDDYSASLDIAATWTDIVNWYNQNKQTIGEVVQVVGEIAALAAS